MKKFIKIISAVLLMSVLLAGAVVAVLADEEFDGKVEEAQALLDAVASAEDLAARRAAMDLVDNYVKGHTFNTDAEEYKAFDSEYKMAEKLLRVDELEELLVAVDAAEAADKAAEKAAAYQSVYDYLKLRPLTDEELREAEFLDDVNSVEINYVTLLVENIEAGTSADPVTVTLDDYRAFFVVLEARPLTAEELDNVSLTERVAEVDKGYILLLADGAKAADATLAICKEYYAAIAEREYDDEKLIALGVSAEDIAKITDNHITALIKEASTKAEFDELFALTAELTAEVKEQKGWTAGLLDCEVKYIGALVDDATALGTIAAYELVFNRIKDKGITDLQLTEKELLDKVDGAEISYAALLLERLDAEAYGTARNGVYLNLFNYAHRGLNQLHPDYATYKELYGELYEAKAKEQADAVAAARAALDEENLFADYSNKIISNFDYDNKVGFGTSSKISLSYSGGTDANEHHPSQDIMNAKGHTYQITNNTDEGNKYLTMLFRTIKEPEDPYYNAAYAINAGFELKSVGSGNSFVWEFDIKTDTGMPTPGHYKNGNVADGNLKVYIRTPNAKDNKNLFSVNSKGTLSASGLTGGTSSSVNLDGAVSQGGWTHLSFVFHADTMTLDMYLNYEYLGSKSIVSTTDPYELYNVSIRLDDTAADGDFALDNFQIYLGDKIRIIDKYDNYTEEEMFVLYGQELLNTESHILNRYDIYKTMTAMLTEWGENYDKENADIVAAIEAYNQSDIAAAQAAVKEKTLAEFRDLVNGLVALGRRYDNAAARQKEADRIQNIVHYYGHDVDRTNPEYIELEATYQKWKADAVADVNTASFTQAMQQFMRANKADQKQKFYDNATTYYDLLDITTLNLPTFEPFREAYEAYAGAAEQIAVLLRADNSRTIVLCMEFLAPYTTEFEWDENEATIKKYINIVSKILATHTEDNPAYNDDYEGIGEALEFYEEISAYFYKKEQKVHAAKLTGFLNDLKLAESYIEKLGFVSSFEGYLALHDIDENDDSIAAVIESYEEELVKVKAAEDEYKAVLASNTQKFKEAVANMEAAKTYLEKKAYYDEATDYYYVMTPGNAEDEIAKYEAGKVELDKVVADSIIFVGLVEKLSFATDKSEMFALLVECCRYAPKAESTLDGVADALVSYNALYKSYVESVNTIKGEIDTTQFVSGTVRANCGADTIVKIIYSIIPTLEFN